MHIAVFGVGGVGGYFGGRLTQAGEEVTFIARGEHLRAMKENGLLVESIKGDFHLYPVTATDDPYQIGEVDVVLVGVKAWQVPEAAEAMRPLIGPETFIVSLQNGVDAPTQLASVLGDERVLGGLCQISSFVAGPGHIKHVAIEPFVAFGELKGGGSERAERLRSAFERAGVKVEVPDDIQAALWKKFLFIASISGVGAVTRAPAGDIRKVPETRSVLVRAMEEIEAVARAHGVRIDSDIVDKTIAFVDKMPEGTVASMQRDIMEGRPSELEYQNGAVVRMGIEKGVPTPTHAFLYASLLPQEMQARGEIRIP